MPRWEYSELSNPASGSDGVIFSHPQRATIVDEFKATLGKGLKAENSHTRWLYVNLGHTSVLTPKTDSPGTPAPLGE